MVTAPVFTYQKLKEWPNLLETNVHECAGFREKVPQIPTCFPFRRLPSLRQTKCRLGDGRRGLRQWSGRRKKEYRYPSNLRSVNSEKTLNMKYSFFLVGISFSSETESTPPCFSLRLSL